MIIQVMHALRIRGQISVRLVTKGSLPLSHSSPTLGALLQRQLLSTLIAASAGYVSKQNADMVYFEFLNLPTGFLQ